MSSPCPGLHQRPFSSPTKVETTAAAKPRAPQLAQPTADGSPGPARLAGNAILSLQQRRESAAAASLLMDAFCAGLDVASPPATAVTGNWGSSEQPSWSLEPSMVAAAASLLADAEAAAEEAAEAAAAAEAAEETAGTLLPLPPDAATSAASAIPSSLILGSLAEWLYEEAEETRPPLCADHLWPSAVAEEECEGEDEAAEDRHVNPTTLAPVRRLSWPVSDEGPPSALAKLKGVVPPGSSPASSLAESAAAAPAPEQPQSGSQAALSPSGPIISKSSGWVRGPQGWQLAGREPCVLGCQVRIHGRQLSFARYSQVMPNFGIHSNHFRLDYRRYQISILNLPRFSPQGPIHLCLSPSPPPGQGCRPRRGRAPAGRGRL